MIIRSQDKKLIVNMDNIDTLEVVGVNIRYFNGGSETAGRIATYSTEEKAIKVLDKIQNAYTQYGSLKDGFGSIHGVFNLPKVFQMPQDSEV